MIAKIGRRRKPASPTRNQQNVHPDLPSVSWTGEQIDLQVADSDLVVVKAFLEGSQISDTLNASVEFVKIPWGMEILDQLDVGNIDMAIFNRNMVRRYIKEHPETNIRSLGETGYSMGGAHFCMIAHGQHPLQGDTIEELKSGLSGRKVVVGVNTDRYHSFLHAFQIDGQYLEDNSISVIDEPEPHLHCFKLDPGVIIIGGQNVRFEAKLDGSYQEISLLDQLPLDRKQYVKDNACNVLVVGKNVVSTGGIEEWYDMLFEAFHRNAYMHLDNLLRKLVSVCDFGAITDPSQKEKIARHVLYETYRVGNPNEII